MCTLFANLYVLLTRGPHMVYMGTPYIFDIYMIRYGWLGSNSTLSVASASDVLHRSPATPHFLLPVPVMSYIYFELLHTFCCKCQ